MPPIGLLLGGVSFTDLKMVLQDAVLDADAPQPIVSSKDSTDLDSDRDPIG